MKTYEIPRNYKGESRILYIFSTKALIYTIVGMGIGLIFYFILSAFGFGMAGIITVACFALIGFLIGTLKMPDLEKFEFTRKTGGENIDNVIKRAIKFKLKGKRIYVYREEERNAK